MDTDPLLAGARSAIASAHTSSLKGAPIRRLELITRGERRRRWTVEQKQTIAAASFVPGASPTVVAREHGISTGQLYSWRHALMAAQPAAMTQAIGRFAHVEVASGAVADRGLEAARSTSAGEATRRPGIIEIALSDGTTVRVDEQIDLRALRRVLAVLRG
jgi:transposase